MDKVIKIPDLVDKRKVERVRPKYNRDPVEYYRPDDHTEIEELLKTNSKQPVREGSQIPVWARTRVKGINIVRITFALTFYQTFVGRQTEEEEEKPVKVTSDEEATSTDESVNDVEEPPNIEEEKPDIIELQASGKEIIDFQEEDRNDMYDCTLEDVFNNTYVDEKKTTLIDWLDSIYEAYKTEWEIFTDNHNLLRDSCPRFRAYYDRSAQVIVILLLYPTILTKRLTPIMDLFHARRVDRDPRKGIDDEGRYVKIEVLHHEWITRREGDEKTMLHRNCFEVLNMDLGGVVKWQRKPPGKLVRSLSTDIEDTSCKSHM